MKTYIRLISLLGIMLIGFGSNLNAMILFDNPTSNVYHLFHANFNDDKIDELETFQQLSIMYTETVTELSKSETTYLNLLFGKTKVEREFYIKKFTSTNEEDDIKTTVYKMKFGNLIVKVILNNWKVVNVLTDKK